MQATVGNANTHALEASLTGRHPADRPSAPARQTYMYKNAQPPDNTRSQCRLVRSPVCRVKGTASCLRHRPSSRRPTSCPRAGGRAA